MSNLYLLTRKVPVGYDEFDDFLVRAESDEEARQIVSKRDSAWSSIWLDEEQSCCSEVQKEGAVGIIIEGYGVSN